MFDGGFITRLQRALGTDAEGEDLVRAAYDAKNKSTENVFVCSQEKFDEWAKSRVNLTRLKNIVLEPKGRYVVKCAIVPGFIKNEWQIWYVEGLEEKFNSSSYVHDKTEDRCEQLNAEHLINLILKELGLKL